MRQLTVAFLSLVFAVNCSPRPTPDKCAGVQCVSGNTCDPADGQCKPSGTGGGSGGAGGNAGGRAGGSAGGTAGGATAGGAGGGTAGGATAGGSGGGTAGGATAGGAGGGTAGGAAGGNATSAQIDTIRTVTPDSGYTLPVTGATVTYVKPAVGTDPAGFFVQSEQAGPAVFVAVDPTTLSPVPAVGDRVDFTATVIASVSSMRHVQAISSYARTAGGTLSGLVQNLSAATDLVTNVSGYESEVLTMNATVFDAGFSNSGTAHSQAFIATAGMQGSGVRLRVPDTVRDALDLTGGCVVTVNNTPLWRFTTTPQVSGWVNADLTVMSCPAPFVVSATAASPTSVVVRFFRKLMPSSVMANGSQFTLSSGGTVSSAVLAANGTDVTLTVANVTGGQTYTVTAAASLADTRGTALGMPNSATFTGFVAPATLVINEVNVNLAGGKDLVEVLAVQGGSVNGYTLEAAVSTALGTFPNIVAATGDIFVVHLSPAAAGGGVDSNTETTAKNEFPTATNSANFDNAWDIRGASSGMSFTSQTIRIRDALGNVVHGVSFSGGGVNPPAGWLQGLAQIQDAGLWFPGNCGGAACSATSTPTATEVSADWAGLSTMITGQSVQRLPGANASMRSDWAKDGGQSWGAPNN